MYKIQPKTTKDKMATKAGEYLWQYWKETMHVSWSSNWKKKKNYLNYSIPPSRCSNTVLCSTMIMVLFFFVNVTLLLLWTTDSMCSAKSVKGLHKVIFRAGWAGEAAPSLGIFESHPLFTEIWQWSFHFH
jgi:hypothetical protein